jgi:hypothetical protein
MSSRGSYFYEDEDDLDIRVVRQRSRSPAPHLYHQPPEPQYRHTRPPYYETHSHGSGHGYIQGSGGFLIPAVSGGLHRSRSHGHRHSPPPPAPQPQQPVVINNRIYNDRDDDDDYHIQLAPIHSRSRSRSRAGSFVSSRDPRDDYELEKTRQELAAYKLEKEKKEEEKRIKKELELERLRKEKEEEEEEERLKKERKAAIEKYKLEEAEKAAKAKKEKEEREKEYQKRFEEDLRKSGMDQKQIAVVLGKDKDKCVDPQRPTYTRMSRKHLSIETLNRYRIDYEFDHVRTSLPRSRPELIESRIRITFLSKDGSLNTNKTSCGPTREKSEKSENAASQPMSCSALKARRNTMMRLSSNSYERRSTRESHLPLLC